MARGEVYQGKSNFAEKAKEQISQHDSTFKAVEDENGSKRFPPVYSYKAFAKHKKLLLFEHHTGE